MGVEIFGNFDGTVFTYCKAWIHVSNSYMYLFLNSVGEANNFCNIYEQHGNYSNNLYI